MAEFIYRQEEMQTRRVGKTTLISEFIKNFNNI